MPLYDRGYFYFTLTEGWRDRVLYIRQHCDAGEGNALKEFE